MRIVTVDMQTVVMMGSALRFEFLLAAQCIEIVYNIVRFIMKKFEIFNDYNMLFLDYQ